MYSSLYCITCKSTIHISPDYSADLAKHAVTNNHFVYTMEETSGRYLGHCCCEFCSNENILLLGYSTRKDNYLCINCISNKSYFKDFLDWKDTYVSWYPLALSSELIPYLKANPLDEQVDSPLYQKMFGVLLNRYALSKISKEISKGGNDIIEGSYSVLGYGDHSTCIQINLANLQDHKEIMPTSCCEINFFKGKQHVDAVVIMCSGNNVVFALRNLNVGEVSQQGRCQVRFSTQSWCDMSFFTTSGLLVKQRNINSYLMGRWMGHGVSEVYRDVNLHTFPWLSLPRTEYRNLSAVVKNVLSIVECGEDVHDQIKYAGLAGISIQRHRNNRIVYLSTNEDILDMVTMFLNRDLNRFNGTNNEVYCVRACANTYHPTNASATQANYGLMIQPPKDNNPRTKLDYQCKAESDKVAIMKSHWFVAASISEIPLLSRLYHCSFIILDSEYISNARLSGLIPYASQMVLFCRNRDYTQENIVTDGIGGLATHWLMDHHTPVVNIHSDTFTLRRWQYNNRNQQRAPKEDDFKPVVGKDSLDLPLSEEPTEKAAEETPQVNSKQQEQRKEVQHQQEKREEVRDQKAPLGTRKRTAYRKKQNQRRNHDERVAAENKEEEKAQEEVVNEVSEKKEAEEKNEKKEEVKKEEVAVVVKKEVKGEAKKKKKKEVKKEVKKEEVAVEVKKDERKEVREEEKKEEVKDAPSQKQQHQAGMAGQPKPRRNGRDRTRMEKRMSRKNEETKEKVASEVVVVKEVKQDEVKQEKMKQEVKQEEVKQEEVKQEEVKQEEVKQEEVKQEEVKEEVKEVKIIKEEVKEEVKEEEVKEEKVKEEEVKEEEVKEEVKQEVKEEVKEVREEVKEEKVKEEEVKEVKEVVEATGMLFNANQYDDAMLLDPALSSEVGMTEKDFDLPAETTEILPVDKPLVEPSFVVNDSQTPEDPLTSERTSAEASTPSSQVPPSPPVPPTIEPPKRNTNPFLMPYIPGFLHM